MPKSHLAQAIAGTVAVLAAATLAGIPLFGSVLGFGSTRPLAEIPWFLPVAQSFMILSAFAITVLLVGRYAALGGSWAYWTGAIFLASGILGLFYLLAWPGLIGDRGLIAHHSNTGSWFFFVTFSSLMPLLGVVLRAAAPGRGERARTYRTYGLVVVLCTLLALASLWLEESLPTFIVDRDFTPLAILWCALITVVLAVAWWVASRRFSRVRERPLGYLSLFLVLMAFAVAYSVLGGKRYDIWWYAARFVYDFAYLAMLFGLLQEGYGLFAREQQLAEERARLLESELRARRAAELAVERVARLQRVTAALSRALTPDEVAGAVLQQVIDDLGAGAGLVAQLVRDNTWFEIVKAAGYAEATTAPWQQFPAGAPVPLAEAVRTGLPVALTSIAERDARFPNLTGVPTGFEASLSVPLIVDGRPVGALGLSIREPHTFTAEEVQFAVALGQQCAQAFERARLYAAEQAARAQAEAAVSVRDHFLTIASHELKTPLTVLLGSAQAILRRARADRHLPERDTRALELIVAQSQKLNRMVVALLDVSRLQSGSLLLENEPVDLGALAARVVNEMQATLADRRILFFEEGGEPGGPLIVSGDELRIEQALQNLVQNAVRYSPMGGPIEVRAGRDGDSACVSVTDHGLGIPAAALPHIFERFYRAPNAEDQHIGGLGMGLYIADSMVALHGGSITVESREGEGSTFTVRLPLAPGVSRAA